MGDDMRNLLGKAATHAFRSATGRCRKCGVELPMLARVTGTRLCAACAHPAGGPLVQAPAAPTPGPFTAIAAVAKRVQAAMPNRAARELASPSAMPPNVASPPTGNCAQCGQPLPISFRISGRTDCDVCRATATGLSRDVAEAVIQTNKASATSATYVRGPWGLRSGAVGKFTFDADAMIFTAGMFTKESFRIPFASIADVVMKVEAGGLNISTSSSGSGSFGHSSSTVSRSVAKYVCIGHIDDTGAPAVIVFSGSGFSDAETVLSKLMRARHDYRVRNG